MEKKKYDVAISFAEEDRNIAAALECGLELLKIKAYYYPEKSSETIGYNLNDVLPRLYKDEAHYAVIILSEHYPKKKFCQVELKAISERMKSQQDRYLVIVKTDETLPEDIELSNDLVYVMWEHNPKKLAESLASMLGKRLPDKERKATESYQAKNIITKSNFHGTTFY